MTGQFGHTRFRLLRGVLALCLTAQALAPTAAAERRQPRRADANSYRPSAQDDSFLEDLSRRTFLFFREHADARTGLVRDRARTDGSPTEGGARYVASIASTGFGLTALCVAAERGWMARAEAAARARLTLRFLAEQMPQQRGWFYHFVDMRTGERVWQSELSSIDTTLLLAGVLTARQYFRDDAEIVRHAAKIYERVDYPWMLNGHPYLLSMGWRPESGFIQSRWDGYSEHTMLYLMAIGSPTHPIPRDSWYWWCRDWNTYGGRTFLGRVGLFTHQYSQAWVDYRGRREDRASRVNYFENSVTATRAHREFCVDLSKKFPGYSENVWGITASDGPEGYRAWSGPPATEDIDGTVAPAGPAGSLMFAPDICLPALREMRQKYGGRIWGRYGFTDAFNPTTGWVNPDVIGIDVGITLLSAENLRTGNVWRWFMRNPEIPRALNLVGLRPEAARPAPNTRRPPRD